MKTTSYPPFLMKSAHHCNLWMGETLLYMDDADEMKKGVTIMMKEAKRLMKLVEISHEFTMLDSGRLKMRMDKIDIALGLKR